MEIGTLKIGDRVMLDPSVLYGDTDQSSVFEIEDIYQWNQRFENCKLKGYGAVHSSWLKLVEPEPSETVKTITESDFEALVMAVFDKIASLPYYDENNEPQARGIGEMGDTRDEATEVVKDWMGAQNIKLID